MSAVDDAKKYLSLRPPMENKTIFALHPDVLVGGLLDEIERLREALRLMPKTITDAADEIERLRKALTELDSAINQWLSTGSVMKKWMLKIIADALKEGE